MGFIPLQSQQKDFFSFHGSKSREKKCFFLRQCSNQGIKNQREPKAKKMLLHAQHSHPLDSTQGQTTGHQHACNDASIDCVMNSGQSHHYVIYWFVDKRCKALNMTL